MNYITWYFPTRPFRLKVYFETLFGLVGMKKENIPVHLASGYPGHQGQVGLLIQEFDW